MSGISVSRQVLPQLYYIKKRSGFERNPRETKVMVHEVVFCFSLYKGNMKLNWHNCAYSETFVVRWKS